MASPRKEVEDEPPQVIFTRPSLGPARARLSNLRSRSDSNTHIPRKLHRNATLRPKSEKHVRLEEPEGSRPISASSSIYMGSYSRSPRRSRVSLGDSLHTPEGSVPPSPRASMSHIHLEHLLQDLNLDLDSYGVEEFRDGFFDASFFKPRKDDLDEMMKTAEYTLPDSFRKRHPLSISAFFPKQWHEIKGVFRRVTTTRAGIKLVKSFSAFFVAYILCLIPVTGSWLGPFNFVMPLSTVINHPGRTIGAQLDGTFLTIVGTAGGLGWGAFALWLSNSTPVAASGYGGILAMFLVIFMAVIAVFRSYFIRSYQMVLCAGIAVIYTCLSNTSTTVEWRKLLDWGVPWLFGQALSLIICFTVFPDGGARPLAVSLHNAFGVMQDGLELPRNDDIMVHRQLAWTFVNLSQAYRDLTLDISVTRFVPSDIASLRNLMQAVVRSLLSLKTETELFKDYEEFQRSEDGMGEEEAVVDIDGLASRPHLQRTQTEEGPMNVVCSKLAQPTLDLLACMRNALERCDAVLLEMSGYRKYLGPPSDVSSDILGALNSIRKGMIAFDEADDALIDNPEMPTTYSDHPEVVKLFLFVNPIRQAATSTEALMVKVMEMQQRRSGWKIYLPSYPFAKSLQRTNAQVRHDRGGITAGFFFRSQKELNRILAQVQKSSYRPLPRHITGGDNNGGEAKATEKSEDEEEIAVDHEEASKNQLRYKIWLVLHRLQGFETRFAFKVVIVVLLLAVPAWVESSREWYNKYESWWAVVMTWVMMHPRVGGNFQDLVTRSLTAVIGALWGALAYAARDGDPYVMAAFAAIYMVPMIYRFTQSSHPRSGVVGCISFVVVSLSAYNLQGSQPIQTLAWTRGMAFVVGVVSAVVVNWILWPFVARHELRKSISAMMLHSAIVYRGVVAKYIYYEDGNEPSEDDVARSELLEGRLREGFVRIRQLMALTRHEIRLRGPFNPLPYSALIENCESFFEHLVEVRQSSLFFHPNYMADNVIASEALLPFRRDAVAAILMNLYVLAGALRGNRKVPRYLPSAAAARKRLLDRMAEVEAEHALAREGKDGAERGEGSASTSRSTGEKAGLVGKRSGGRKFAEVYQFAYSKALTQCVEQLEELQKYTKAICGEVGFDLDELEEEKEEGEETVEDVKDGPVLKDAREGRT